jgi:hypothetical protein
MKKFAVLSLVLFLAAFILLPEPSIGKYNVSKPIVADGSPLPWPPIPPAGGAAVLSNHSLPSVSAA